MDAASQVIAVLRADPLRWHLLGAVSALNLSDGWIGAGFVRNAIWDHLHGREPSAPKGDVDVIWHDPLCADEAEDREYEAALRAVEPGIAWSVKNQARMHGRNGDEPYVSATDAMRYWPETATAVAVRRTDNDGCEVAAPLGLGDLTQLILRPTRRFVGDKRHIYDERVRSKEWAITWPLLREEAVSGSLDAGTGSGRVSHFTIETVQKLAANLRPSEQLEISCRANRFCIPLIRIITITRT